jgi:hypothetical protein
MRRLTAVVLGLLALGTWAPPAPAGDSDLPKLQEPIPLENRAGRIGAMFRGEEAAFQGTLSGTLLKQAQTPTTTWYLYPNACNDRQAGTWAPRTAIVADSLNTYSTSVVDHGYQLEDQSLKERLWKIAERNVTVPPSMYQPVLDGTRSLWCGKMDENWVVKVGYPNLTFQILYIDTGNHTGNWNLQWIQNVSTEFNYDYLYIIGGNGGVDPIGNSRAILDHITDTGSDAAGNLLVTMTGSMQANLSLSYTAPPGVSASGAGAGPPATVSFSLTGILATHRAIYVLFYSDCLFSGEDGLWPEGHGAILDLVSASDTGMIFSEQATAGGVDAHSGDVLVGTPAAPIISARVAPGVGDLWRINSGNNLPTADFCSPQKSLASDHMFEAGDAATHFTIANTFASIKSCTMPIPSGAASVLALWGEYMDLPRGTGFVQYAEYRVFRGGSWGNWGNTYAGGGVSAGASQAWFAVGDELAAASQADSVQIRYNLQCINFFAVDHINCQPVLYGLLYDDFRLEIVTGVPAPLFGANLGSIAQSTFVDGTDPSSSNCTPAQITAGQCWPGNRGSALTYEQGGVQDNFNCGYGDSITLALATGLRKNGMGINWRYGFDKTVVHHGVGALKLSRANGAFDPAYDVPRVIYRLFDPATLSWSPWDSSELNPTSVALSGPDTILIDSEYRLNWPPADKYYVNEGAGLNGTDIGPNRDENLPGSPGWTLNGNTKYSQARFLPRGTRLQYYFKAVDINGGASYQFSSDVTHDEVADLPYLPGSSVRAPDIIEFDVLPRKYAPGAAGSLASGRTDADVLDLDGTYSLWNNGYDPVTQALRGMGVRADRYRNTHSSRVGIGGRELPGQRLSRLSNFFPNITEYNIVGLLASEYRIIIENSHTATGTRFDEQDAVVVENWWNTRTGSLPDDGDRCIFGSGDDMFNALLNASLSFPQYAQQVSLAQNVFGVASVVSAWVNPLNRQYPVIDDRFAGGGPGLAAPNTYTYPIDGGCPTPNRFDGLTKIGSSDAANSAIYPDGVTEVAGIARMSEKDTPTADNDRNKALAYGYSIQFIRTAGIPTNAANYVRSGVENRMRVLYKFLTSCRTNTAAVTTPCWPCPSNPAEMVSNWATATGFNTATYGDLYGIQDFTKATGVELVEAPKVNRLEGNVPNPFNPETAIRFSAAQPGKVTIRVFDVSGRLVNTLSKNVTETGLNEIRWNGKSADGRPMASGMYFYKIRFANGEESEAKMTMLK